MPDGFFELHLTNVATGEVRITNISVVPTKIENLPPDGVLLYIQYEGTVEPMTKLVSIADSADPSFFEVDEVKGTGKSAEPFFATNTVLLDGGGSHNFSMQVVLQHSALHFQIRIEFDYRGIRHTIYALNSGRDFYVTAPRCTNQGKLDYQAGYTMTVEDLQTKAPENLADGLVC